MGIILPMDFPKIILASKSPRRRELLDLAGIAHTVVVADADESSVMFTPAEPEKYVMDIASLKNDAVYDMLKNDANVNNINSNTVIISSDTIVYIDATMEILGKPKDNDDAVRMLKMMSGGSHRAITGVMLRECGSGRQTRFFESTKVFFRELRDAEIRSYVEECRPLDKAGAYGIQERAAVFASRIEGDCSNIVGLPVCRVYSELMSFVGK